MSPAALKTVASTQITRADCEDFLIHEARLLDDARFDE